jgi:hypothetical protein
MPKSCNKLPDFLVTRMATPFPVQRRGLFSNTEFVPTAHQSVHLASLFVIVQPLLQLMSAVSPICTLVRLVPFIFCKSWFSK